MIDTGKIYFFARPRRFGKSLTISTLDALFSGKKELFEGLYAEEFLNRPDLVVSHRSSVWVIEIKVAYEGQSAEKKAEEAYRQIVEKNYALPYPGAVCLGLGIDDTARQITASRI